MTDDKSRAKAPVIGTFVLEADAPKNRSVFLKTIRQRVRGKYSNHKLVDDNGAMREIGKPMNAMPDIPGQRVRVSPKTLSVTIFDPIGADEEKLACDRINSVMSQRHVRTDAKIAAVPEVTERLDPDRFKTLVIELIEEHDSGKMRLVSGQLPSRAEAEAMDGNQLFDPFFDSPAKPRFVKDYPEWVANR